MALGPLEAALQGAGLTPSSRTHRSRKPAKGGGGVVRERRWKDAHLESLPNNILIFMLPFVCCYCYQAI